MLLQITCILSLTLWSVTISQKWWNRWKNEIMLYITLLIRLHNNKKNYIYEQET